ncbi:MAG: N-acetylmuramoyl-L-alanine amidase [Chitinophagales bacterium]
MSDSGFSYEEMLALEDATFQKEETTRSIFFEPLEPDLLEYTIKNSEQNERGIFKNFRKKRKEKKAAKQKKQKAESVEDSQLPPQIDENVDEITSVIEAMADDIVEDIKKTTAPNSRLNAKVVEKEANEPPIIAQNTTVPEAEKPPIVVKQETKPDIEEQKATINNTETSSKVEKVEIISTPPSEKKKSPIAVVAPEIVKPFPSRFLNIKDIIQERLQEGLFYKEKVSKNQIYLHHTVSNGNPLSAINWWRQNAVRVATAIVVAGRPHNHKSKYADGEIYQCFWSKHWAHHLGLKRRHLLPDSPTNTYLNKHSLGIEIANWGWLTHEDDGRFMALGGKVHVPANQVVEYSDLYKGYQYYHKYTDAQLESVRKLLLYFCDLFDIPTTYHEGMFGILPAALRGEKGIFTHTSVRPDKSDCHPQPELIEMLKSL